MLLIINYLQLMFFNFYLVNAPQLNLAGENKTEKESIIYFDQILNSISVTPETDSSTKNFQDLYKFEFIEDEKIGEDHSILLQNNKSQFLLINGYSIIILNEDFSKNSELTIERKKLSGHTKLIDVLIDNDQYLFIFFTFEFSGGKSFIFEKIDSTGKILWTEKIMKVNFDNIFGKIIKSNNEDFFLIEQTTDKATISSRPQTTEVSIFSKNGKKIHEYSIEKGFTDFKVTDSGNLLGIQVIDTNLFLIDFSEKKLIKKLSIPEGLDVTESKLDISPKNDSLVVSSLIGYSPGKKGFLKSSLYHQFKAIGTTTQILSMLDFVEIQNEVSLFAEMLDPSSPLNREIIDPLGMELLSNKGVLFINNDIVLQIENDFRIEEGDLRRAGSYDLVLIRINNESSKAILIDKDSGGIYSGRNSFYSCVEDSEIVIAYNNNFNYKNKKNDFYFQVYDQNFDIKYSKILNLNSNQIFKVNNEVLNSNGNFYFKYWSKGLGLLIVEKLD